MNIRITYKQMRIMIVLGLTALLASLLLAKTGMLPGGHSFPDASLQSRFGMGYWSSYAVSWLIMAALTAGPYGFYGALIASGVGIALAIALSAVYWAIRSWTRKQVQSY